MLPQVGPTKKARTYSQLALKHYPFSPRINYEAYLIYEELGDHKQALGYLRRANDVWKDADEDYKPAIDARKALAELGV